jgi:hypothetical protein
MVSIERGPKITCLKSHKNLQVNPGHVFDHYRIVYNEAHIRNQRLQID